MEKYIKFLDPDYSSEEEHWYRLYSRGWLQHGRGDVEVPAGVPDTARGGGHHGPTHGTIHNHRGATPLPGLRLYQRHVWMDTGIDDLLLEGQEEE